MMVWKVRSKERLGKYAEMTELELAQAIYKMKYSDGLTWVQVGEEVGLSRRAVAEAMERGGIPLVQGAHLRNGQRNARVLEIANEYHAKRIRISDAVIAKMMKAEGYKKITRQTVAGIIHRARKNGEKAPPVNDLVPSVRFTAHQPAHMPTEPLPPRTPELLALGRVAWDDLKPSQCRYTPSEEAPYFFCGEATMPGRSWCRDCHDNRIKRDLKLEPLRGAKGRPFGVRRQAPAETSRAHAH